MSRGLVFSHFVLDFITHRPDLPITTSGATKVGLGLWNAPIATIIIESLMFVIGVLVYGMTRKEQGREHWNRALGAGRSAGRDFLRERVWPAAAERDGHCRRRSRAVAVCRLGILGRPSSPTFVTVVFATCDPQPLVAPDDEPLARALGDLGVTVVPIPWTEIDPAAVVDAEPIVLRSTWDYHKMPTMFAAWLETLRESGRVVMNTPTIARDNIDKIYLRGLESAGIPIPATRWIDRPDAAGLGQILRDEGWQAAVVKPRIAATAYGTFLITSESDLSETDLAPARASGALVQEFVSEIRERGEISLVFAGNEFSHAVAKYALEGDFRVQQDFGGRVVETTPSAAVHALALQVMALCPATAPTRASTSSRPIAGRY